MLTNPSSYSASGESRGRDTGASLLWPCPLWKCDVWEMGGTDENHADRLLGDLFVLMGEGRLGAGILGQHV